MNKRTIISTLLFLYCLFLPYEEVIITPVGSLLKIIGLITMTVVIIFKRHFFIQKKWMLIIIWLLINLVSVIWVDSFEWWLYFFSIYVSQIAFALLIAHIPLEWVNQNIVKSGFIIGACIASIILIFFPNTSIYTSDGRRTLIIMDANMDPNILAMILLIAVFLVLTIENHKIKYAVIVLLVIGIFCTGSRGVMIAMICSMSMLVLNGLKNKMRRTNSIFIIILALMSIHIVWKYMPTDLISARFSIETILGLNEYNKGVHNRYTIWLHSWKLFCEKPLIGYGCGNFFSAIKGVYRECAAHNLIVLELVELGLIGSFPMFCFLISILRDLRVTRQWNMFYMLISVYIVALSLDTLMYKYFWMTLIFVNWIIRENKGKNDTANKENCT